MRILIVGLGLIGGSVAKTLKKNSDWTVCGYDTDSSVCKEALESCAVDCIWNGAVPVDIDLTVLCLSPCGSANFLRTKGKLLKPDSVVTDVCGIKQSVVAECGKICEEYSLSFVGGHPMAGKERSGFKNSDENLFNRASYILTPTETTDAGTLNLVKEYVSALKVAKLTITTPKHHDRIIAFTSQLPHIIAGSYIQSPVSRNRRGFSAGSFKDVSRVATVDENLWSELFQKNSNSLLPELDFFIEKLLEYRRAIADNDSESLKNIIKQGRIAKENDNKDIEKSDRNA